MRLAWAANFLLTSITLIIGSSGFIEHVFTVPFHSFLVISIYNACNFVYTLRHHHYLGFHFHIPGLEAYLGAFHTLHYDSFFL